MRQTSHQSSLITCLAEMLHHAAAKWSSLSNAYRCIAKQSCHAQMLTKRLVNWDRNKLAIETQGVD